MLDFPATEKRYRGDAVGAIVNKNRASRKYHRIRIVRDEAARLNNLIYRFYRYTAPYLCETFLKTQTPLEPALRGRLVIEHVFYPAWPH